MATMELPVGFCGIIKLTSQIIYRNLKHFLGIAFILALPYAFLLAFTPSSSNTAKSFEALAYSTSRLYNYHTSHGEIPSPPDMPTQPPPYPLLIAILVVSFFRLLTQPLLVFSVCRAVLNKSLACKTSLLAIPQSALNLILTVLCAAGVLLGLCAGMVFLMIIMAAGLLAIRIDPTILMVIWSVVTVGGVIYLRIAWSLTDIVAILEEKRGWEAVKRSMYLVNGSKRVVLRLAVVFGVCVMFLPISAANEASVLWRWSCAVLSLGLQAMTELFSVACTVVLYLSCKSRFKEPVDTLIALSAQFGPAETSAKYMDLESARFDTA